MLRTKKAERIACAATALMLLCAVCLWGLAEPSQGNGSHTVGYEGLLFDQSTVHTIDITMTDWEDFIANATAEEYAQCAIAIDGEKYDNVAIRAKGNTSLSSVSAMDSSRYSFKVEFDHYVKDMTYHGLDKLSLNNLIQDATLMKDYLAYTLMNRMGVPSPLCSYVQINVNGEPWGLYLAVEGIEDAFLERNGMTKGELYKPDSLSFGGGRGNGQDFSFSEFEQKNEGEAGNPPSAQEPGADFSFDGATGAPSDMPELPGGDFGFFGGEGAPDGLPEMGGGNGGFGSGMGSDDVKLIYSDDNPESYDNIFSNVKTDVTEADKARLIEALKKLNAREDLENTVQQEEVIQYLVVHNFLCNDDSYTGSMVHNYYLYEENGQLSIIPWDYNLAFGGFSASSDATSTVNSPIDSPVSSGTLESRPLVAWIFSDESTLAEYHAAYNRFVEETVESRWLESEISRVQTLIAPYLEQDSSAFYSMEEFEKAVDTLKSFCQKRGESIRGQLDGTIPSTNEGQQEDSAALVDASDISTADMGSMNTGRNGGGDFHRTDAAGAGRFTPPSGIQMPGQGKDTPFGGGADANQTGTQPEADAEPPTQPDETAPSDANQTGTQPTADAEPPTQLDGTAPSDAGQAGTQPTADAEPPAQPDGTAPSDAGQTGMNRHNEFPKDGTPADFSQTADRSQWIQVAVWGAILAAAILLILRSGNHNG